MWAHPSRFSGDMFDQWKVRFKVFIKNTNFESWEIIISDLFIHIHYVNGEIIDKHVFLWTKENNGKFQLDFKVENFLVMSFSENQLLYVLNGNFAKKLSETLEMIYGVFLNIEQEKMNTQVQKIESESYHYR